MAIIEDPNFGLEALDLTRPLLFLDFDGVICTEASYDRARGETRTPTPPAPQGFSPDAGDVDAWRHGLHLLDEDLVKRVQLLCDLTQAQVVVSSAWRRNHSPGDLQVMLASRGLHAPLVGVTPYLYRQPRGQEIRLWLDMMGYNPDLPPPMVILEDMEDVTPYLAHQVQPDFDGPRAGFRPRHLKQAVTLYLNQGAITYEEVEDFLASLAPTQEHEEG